MVRISHDSLIGALGGDVGSMNAEWPTNLAVSYEQNLSLGSKAVKKLNRHLFRHPQNRKS